MQVTGRVAAWDPPRRIVFDGGDSAEGLAFEWLVEARDGGSCVVRLVNSGFAVGEEWDDQFDAMTEGWKLFMSNLQLHLAHFGGQSATAMLPMANWSGPADLAWQTLLEVLGIPGPVVVGRHIEIDADATPTLAGTVVEAGERRLALVVDTPAPGTAFIAAEGRGDEISVSIWAYLYGEDGAAAARRDEPKWRSLLESRAIGS